MNHHVSRLGALAVCVSLCLSAAAFLFLNASFGGPTLGLSGLPSYRLTATLDNGENILEKSLVLIRGVQVGYVAGVTIVGDRAQMTIAINPSDTPVYRDATIEIGHRSLFGEAYVRLNPGDVASGRLRSGSVLPLGAVIPTVDFDSALSVLSKPARAHLSSLAHTGALIQQQATSDRELNDTIGGLSQTLSQLHEIGLLLDDQQGQLTALVSDSTAVTSNLATRDQQLTGLVSNARATTEALSADSPALRAGIAQASQLLTVAGSTLTAISPVALRLRPVITKLTAAAPALTAALTRLPTTAAAARVVVHTLPALTNAAVPVLGQLSADGRVVLPLAAALEPALRDLIPVLAYIAPHAADLVGFLKTGAVIRRITAQGTDAYITPSWVEQQHSSTVDGQDGLYAYGEFFFGTANNNLTTGNPQGVQTNPYPKSGQPGVPWLGRYPRLEPAPDPKLS